MASNELDTGAKKMHQMCFLPSKLDSLALLRKKCSAPKKIISIPCKLVSVLEKQWKYVLGIYTMELMLFI